MNVVLKTPNVCQVLWYIRQIIQACNENHDLGTFVLGGRIRHQLVQKVLDSQDDRIAVAAILVNQLLELVHDNYAWLVVPRSLKYLRDGRELVAGLYPVHSPPSGLADLVQEQGLASSVSPVDDKSARLWGDWRSKRTGPQTEQPIQFADLVFKTWDDIEF